MKQNTLLWSIAYTLLIISFAGIILLIYNTENIDLLWWFAWVVSCWLSYYIAGTIEKIGNRNK